MQFVIGVGSWNDQSQWNLGFSVGHRSPRCNLNSVRYPLNWNLFDVCSFSPFPLLLIEIQSKEILLLTCRESKSLQAYHFPFRVHREKLWRAAPRQRPGICARVFPAKPQPFSCFSHHSCVKHQLQHFSKTWLRTRLGKFETCADVVIKTCKQSPVTELAQGNKLAKINSAQ